MGGSGLAQHYPPEKYARLIELILAEEPTATFAILGGGQNDLISAQIVKNAIPEIYNNHIVDLTNKISYRQTAAILSLCDMYIGNDTGTMHVAAAVKCPVLSPNRSPADLSFDLHDNLHLFSHYRVPNVIVQPAKALPECAGEPRTFAGCKSDKPHCIATIAPETLLRGFHILKERISKNLTDSMYIC